MKGVEIYVLVCVTLMKSHNESKADPVNLKFITLSHDIKHCFELCHLNNIYIQDSASQFQLNIEAKYES